MENEVLHYIAECYKEPKTLGRIISEIGSGASDEADHMALSEAIGYICKGETSHNMPGCDENAMECVRRIVRKYVEKEVKWNLGVHV